MLTRNRFYIRFKSSYGVIIKSLIFSKIYLEKRVIYIKIKMENIFNFYQF